MGMPRRLRAPRLWHLAVTNNSPDIAALAALLHETADHHGVFESVAPKHNWWDWYAAYMTARESGSSPKEASKAAGVYMEETFGVRVP
jgi:hypothetical protein